MRIAWVLVALVSTATGRSFADTERPRGDTPEGQYRVTITGAKVRSTLGGKRLPPCGPAAAALLAPRSELTVVYRGTTVKVNGEEWEFVGDFGHLVVATNRSAHAAYMLEIWFWRSADQTAEAYLHASPPSGRRCTSSRPYTGKFTGLAPAP